LDETLAHFNPGIVRKQDDCFSVAHRKIFFVWHFRAQGRQSGVFRMLARQRLKTYLITS
jgi:hypothetical protein